MTCQVPEQIEYEGQLLTMYSEPLQDKLPPTATYGGRPDAPDVPYPFEVSCSALWRGYVGRWRIEDGRLYLVEIVARTPTGEDASLRTLFPNTDGAVFANWYTGDLSIERGQIIGRVDGFYLNVYEESVTLKGKSGVVVGKQVRRNQVPEGSDW